MRRMLLAVLIFSVIDSPSRAYNPIDPVSCAQWQAPQEYPLCAPDVVPNDYWNVGGSPRVSGHYLLVKPACGSPPYPLLVLFRGWGVVNAPPTSCDQDYPAANHWSPWERGDLMRDASVHGWYALSVLGAPSNIVNYGPPQGLYNTELAIQQILQNSSLQIDRERVYAVGFSAGGASELAYASRHLDPESDAGIFAAAVILSGITSTSHLWEYYDGTGTDVNPWRRIWESMLGLSGCAGGTTCATCASSPCDSAFDYQRSSGVYTHFTTADPNRSIVQNLKHMPLWGLVDSADMAELVQPQMALLNDVLQGGQNWHYQVGTYPTCLHCWNLYKDMEMPSAFGADIFTLLGNETLTGNLPDGARVLAADDTWYFHFRVHRRDSHALGDFEWEVPPGQNRLNLRRVGSNVDSLRVRTAGSGTQHHSGLDPESQLQMMVEASPAEPLPMLLDVTFEGYERSPLSVTQTPNTGASWFWDQNLKTLRLRQRPTSTTATWIVQPAP